ncbi:choline O-acetyltransferase, partial [Striga asiatica]
GVVSIRSDTRLSAGKGIPLRHSFSESSRAGCAPCPPKRANVQLRLTCVKHIATVQKIRNAISLCTDLTLRGPLGGGDTKGSILREKWNNYSVMAIICQQPWTEGRDEESNLGQNLRGGRAKYLTEKGTYRMKRNTRGQ